LAWKSSAESIAGLLSVKTIFDILHTIFDCMNPLPSDGNKKIRDSLKWLVGYCNNPQPDFSTPKHRRYCGGRSFPGLLVFAAILSGASQVSYSQPTGYYGCA